MSAGWVSGVVDSGGRFVARVPPAPSEKASAAFLAAVGINAEIKSLAQANVIKEQAFSEAEGDRRKGLAQAEAVGAKAEAMKALSDAGRGHEGPGPRGRRTVAGRRRTRGSHRIDVNLESL